MQTAVTSMEKSMTDISFAMIENVTYTRMDTVTGGNERTVVAFKYEN